MVVVVDWWWTEKRRVEREAGFCELLWADNAPLGGRADPRRELIPLRCWPLASGPPITVRNGLLSGHEHFTESPNTGVQAP
jgi:hypothetical protein